MLRILATISALFLASIGIARASDPFFPTFGNPGIDVRHYNLTLDISPATGHLAGHALLLVRATDKLNSFSLDLHKLAVSKVQVDGIAATFTQANDKLTITPRWPLIKGAPFVVNIAYAGVPEAIADPTDTSHTYTLGWFKYGKSTYVVSEPVGASTFFPANDQPTDKATFSYAVTVPSNYTAVANGQFAGSLTTGAKKRFLWAMLKPMTTWLATVAVNTFDLEQAQTASGKPVRVFYPHGEPVAVADGYAKAARMIDYFETKIGTYPFASYGSVLVQDPILYYALETQTMSIFPDDGTVPDEALVAHELAHQWFGDSVSVAHWADLWFAEGSATYFETLWPNRNNPAGFTSAMNDLYAYAVSAALGPAVVDKPEDLFSDRTYVRGALSLYALRQTVGDPTFFRILRRFLHDNAGGNITSQQFIDNAVAVSGNATVRPLLHAWLYDQALPNLPGAAPRVAGAPVPKLTIVGACGRDGARCQR